MTVTANIRAALEGQIAGVTGIPAADQRAWENVRFEPTTGATWVRMQLAPSQSRPATRGPSPQIRHEGLFLVFVNTPEGGGPVEADTLADNIRNAYTVDDVLTSNGVNVRFEWSERSVAVLDAPWYRVTVSARYYCYAAT